MKTEYKPVMQQNKQDHGRSEHRRGEQQVQAALLPHGVAFRRSRTAHFL